MAKRLSYTHEGVNFPSFSAMAAAFGIPPASLRSRLEAKWPLDRALRTPIHKTRLTINGETFSVDQAAKRFGTSAYLIRSRLSRGVADDDAVREPRGAHRHNGHQGGVPVVQRLREFRDQLKNKPCHDCGQKYPPYVMDFDHRENKKRLVSKMGTFKGMLAEAAKCDVVCANCHRIRTHLTRPLGLTSP